MKMTNRGEVLGEVDPGFNLWTSAHGFHHLSLSNRKVWKILWALVLILVIGGLIAVLVYYFVHVFTFAKYSVVTLESPGTYHSTTNFHVLSFSVRWKFKSYVISHVIILLLSVSDS